MAGIKDLVGLLFWMDNNTMSTMKAVSKGEREMPRNKSDILQHINDLKKNGSHKKHRKINGAPIISKHRLDND